LCFDAVDMSGVTGIDLQMAAANTGGVFSVRLDGSTGTEVGRYTVSTSTGGWGTWQTRTVSLAQAGGVHSLCLHGGSCFRIMNLDWIELNGSSASATVGATVPFFSYEAEAGQLGGGAAAVSLTSAPTTRYSSPELESSGHAYVHLNATNQYVEWT